MYGILDVHQARERGFVFELEGPYQKVYVPETYVTVDAFALATVYRLWSMVAKMMGVDRTKIQLFAHCQNGKSVFIAESSQYRDLLYQDFQVPSLGAAQLYEDISPQKIMERLDHYMKKGGK